MASGMIDTSDVKSDFSLEAKIKETNIRHLKNYIPVDLGECGLERFLHADATISPNNDLGNLEKLPVELHLMVLDELDLKSVMSFSQVNKKAVQVVNGMRDWQKVMKCAPDTVRMAIGCNTADMFTIKQLVSALNKRNCALCGELAPYLNVYLLERRCNRVGEGSRICKNTLDVAVIPVSKEGLCRISKAAHGHMPHFRALPDVYNYWNSGLQMASMFYDSRSYRALYPMSKMDPIVVHAPVQMTSVFAPWPSATDANQTDMGIFCAICRDLKGHEFYPELRDAEYHGMEEFEDHEDYIDRCVMACRIEATFCTDLAALLMHVKEKHRLVHVEEKLLLSCL